MSVVSDLFAELEQHPEVVMVVVDKETFKQIEADLLPQLRYTLVRLASAGFENLMVRGVPVMYGEGGGGRMFLTELPWEREEGATPLRP